MNAIAFVEDEVRELIRRRGLDPATNPGETRRLVDEVVVECTVWWVFACVIDGDFASDRGTIRGISRFRKA